MVNYLIDFDRDLFSVKSLSLYEKLKRDKFINTQTHRHWVENIVKSCKLTEDIDFIRSREETTLKETYKKVFYFTNKGSEIIQYYYYNEGKNKNLNKKNILSNKEAEEKWNLIKNRGSMQCTRCLLVKDLSEYRKINSRKVDYDLWSTHCNVCDAFRAAKYKTKKTSTIEGSLHSLYTQIKRRCRNKGWSLDFEADYLLELWEKQKGICYYTGLEMEFQKTYNPKVKNARRRNDNLMAVSVDRLDSLVGYQKDNIVLCTWGSNSMKQDFTYDQFIEFAENIVRYKDAKQKQL